MVDSAAAKTAAKCLRKLSHTLCPLVFQVIYEEPFAHIKIIPVSRYHLTKLQTAKTQLLYTAPLLVHSGVLAAHPLQ